MDVDLGFTLKFLADLKSHNDREWFEAHRGDYEDAHAAFLQVVGQLITGLGKVDDLGSVSPKDCVFRIYRDVRFSKDKSPYKPNMGGLIGPEGRRSNFRGYYIHVEPGASFLAGGLYAPTGEELASLRSAIAADSRPLKRILAAKAFTEEFGSISGDLLKTVPQGYPKDHPDIQLLRYKQYTAMRMLSDKDLTKADFIQTSLATFAAMKPFLHYIANTVAGGW